MDPYSNMHTTTHTFKQKQKLLEKLFMKKVSDFDFLSRILFCYPQVSSTVGYSTSHLWKVKCPYRYN